MQVRGVDFTLREQPKDITRRLLRLVQIDETQVNTAALPTLSRHWPRALPVHPSAAICLTAAVAV